ncbi:Acetyltransferase (GNAT) family protein [Microbispora rosea]|uniref:Acetyltransferase (GNAT) family protein n=1 Tax=Microbispora rosea TaxID=58117 RepID=A0A1N6VCB9_9ACTN|nr:acetyltransferase [Microbispora rosea subsp. rosea]SIQ75482.1 Acetyltransferase (GNAT) family protein [Microbispora rosea]
MTNVPSGADEPLAAAASPGNRAPRALWHPGSMARVTANFRQYLTGWGAADRGEGDLGYFRSGLAQPQFNGVVRVRSLAAVEQITATARDRLAGVPWWWWVGPDSPAGTSSALTTRGAQELTTLPVMVRSLDQAVDPMDPPAGLRIEAVTDHDRLPELVRTYSASMGVAPSLEPDIVRIESQRRDNADIVRLAAVLEDRVVGTTTVIAAHDVAGIFLVHVADTHRRRGVGTALTAAALRVGRDRGTRLAALAASPAGEPLYRRFGFVEVSRYRLFAFPS